MRRRAILLILFPIILFLWMIGWSLYWIGDIQTTNKHPNNNEPQIIHLTTDTAQEQTISQ